MYEKGDRTCHKAHGNDCMRAALAIVATRAFEKSALGPKSSKECNLYRLDLADTVGECCAGEVHDYTRDCGKPLTENLQPVNNNSSRPHVVEVLAMSLTDIAAYSTVVGPGRMQLGKVRQGVEENSEEYEPRLNMSRGRLRYVTFNSRGGIMGINLSVQLSKKTPKIKATPPAPSNAIVAALTSVLALIKSEQQTHDSADEEKGPDENKLANMCSECLAVICWNPAGLGMRQIKVASEFRQKKIRMEARWRREADARLPPNTFSKKAYLIIVNVCKQRTGVSTNLLSLETPMDMSAPDQPVHPPDTKKCNKLWCKRRCHISQNCCDTCRENNKRTQNKKRAAKANSMTGTTTSRKRRASIGGADGRPTTPPRIDESSEDDGTHTRGDAEREGAESDDDMPGDEEDSQAVETFTDAESFCKALRAKFKAGSAVDFHGAYPIAVGPMAPEHAFKWSQKRSGSLVATNLPGIARTTGAVRTKAAKHVCYVNVSMPPEALAMIHDNVEWLTPAAMVMKVQAAFPTVTAAQICRAWVELSGPFWGFEDDQLLASTSPNAAPPPVAAAQIEPTARDSHAQQETCALVPLNNITTPAPAACAKRTATSTTTAGEKENAPVKAAGGVQTRFGRTTKPPSRTDAADSADHSCNKGAHYGTGGSPQGDEGV
ncbi:hypothetical protein B0H14DRAFT_2574601 [Mycena olivaceomarginata]|nr:hypothetical protein B0H14DRAFT_2574601 [Mycena olivaceomarginata]